MTTGRNGTEFHGSPSCLGRSLSGRPMPRYRFAAHFHHDSADVSAVLVAHGVDAEKVLRLYSRVLRYDVARICNTIAALKALGVDYAKALNRWPTLWSIDPPCWGERLAVLQGLNLDVAKVVTKCPALLGHPPDTLRAKLEALSGMGLKVAYVVRRCPSVFTLSDDRIRSTIAFLNSVGLDGVRVVNGFPAILCSSVDSKLRPVVHFVTVTMGRDVTKLHTCPHCFSLSMTDRLIPRYQFAVVHNKQHLSLGTLFCTTEDRFAKTMG